MILAGGLSSRMGGGDKGLRVIGGESLLARVIARLGPQCGALALNANGDPARFSGFGLPVLADSLPDRPGPLAGVLAAMDWAAGQGAGSVVTVSADAPFLPLDLVQRLAAAAAAAAGGGGLAHAAGRDEQGGLRDHPICGLWPVSLRDDLRAALAAGRRRVRDFTESHGAARAIWDSAPLDPFFNVNSPEDLDRAEALAARSG